jgi:hypothetical protein
MVKKIRIDKKQKLSWTNRNLFNGQTKNMYSSNINPKKFSNDMELDTKCRYITSIVFLVLYQNILI